MLPKTITTTSDKDPVQRAREVYMSEICARSFEEDFYLHWNNPWAMVYKDSKNLALIRPIDIFDPYEKVTDPSYNSSTPNGWWLYLLVGDFYFLVHRLPYRLKYVGWERNNEPRFYKLERLLRWTLKAPITHPISSAPMVS